MNSQLAAALRHREDRTLADRIAFLEGVMAERELVYPTAQAEWELNPLQHPDRTLEDRVTSLERRIEAWSRRPLPGTL